MYKRIPKYKVGSRVCIKKMSDKHCNKYGGPANIGKVGTIKEYKYQTDRYYPYIISFNNSSDSIGYLEEELELIVEIGQQLEFDFMKE